MSPFFYLFTIVINLWHQKFVIAAATAVFVNKQHGIQRRGQDFDKKSLYLKRYTPKRSTDEFPEKSWTKHGVKSGKIAGQIGTVYIATKRNHTTTGSFQSHPHFTKENNHRMPLNA